MTKHYRQRLLRAGRFLWVLLAIAFAVYFVERHHREVADYIASVGVTRAGAAFALLAAAQLAYAANVHAMLCAAGAAPTAAESFRAYAISQLGKYIPGSIWQFVGRIDIYRKYGVQPIRALQLLLFEHVALLATAGLIAVAALPQMTVSLGGLPTFETVAIAAGLGAVVLLPLSWAGRKHWLAVLNSLWAHRSVVGLVVSLFVLMWILMGLSIYLLVPEVRDVSVIYVVSLFALSFILGFVAIFAPAGLGIREAVFTAGLAAFVGVPIAAGVAIVHRALYVLADLTLGCIGLLIATPPKTQT